MTVNDSQILELRYLQRSRYSDSLRGIRSWERILVGARFSIPVQTDTLLHRSFLCNEHRFTFRCNKAAGAW
jgi:hypothetical protein